MLLQLGKLSLEPATFTTRIYITISQKRRGLKKSAALEIGKAKVAK